MSSSLVKRNTILNIIRSICTVVFPLITFPYISRTLLADGVGKINFGNSIVSYFSLFASLGITTYALKECARNRNSRESLSITASEIFSINVCSTLLSYAILALFIIFAKPLYNYRSLIVIQSTAILFNTLGAEWINSAMEDFAYITFRSVFFQGLSIVLMFIFVHQPEDYMRYAAITVLSACGSNIVNVFYRKKFCDIYFTFRMNVKKHLPPILLFFSMVLAQQVYVNSDITILGLYKSDYEVGLYSTSVKIYNIVNSVVASVSTVVWPQIAEAYKRGRQSDVNRLSKYSLNFIFVLGLPSIVGINVIAKELILLIAGEEYVGATMSLHILTVALLFSFLGGWIGSTMFLPNSKESICLIASTVAAVVNIVLNLVFIPFFGLNAAAATTAIAEGVSLIFLLLHFDKNMKIDGIYEMLEGPVLGSAFIIASSVVIRIFFDAPILICILTMFSSVVGYFGVLVFVKDTFLMGYINPIVRKLKKGVNKK